ncbi:hypothetical protein MTO96_019798 [Rhipicephalus appendiculatus]
MSRTELQRRSPAAPTATDLWNPIQYVSKEPTEKCLVSVLRHTRELHIRGQRLGIFVEPEDQDVTMIHTVVLGPEGTPYEGGFFHFLLKCPEDYPSRPPLVRLMTTDSGMVRFHPSLYENGKVCLALLGTDVAGPTRVRNHSILNVMTIIRSLLADENPVPEGSAFGVLPAVGTWLNSRICYNTVLQHETIRVAVCDAVEDCLKGTSFCPIPLRNDILKHFRQFYDRYEKVVRDRLPLAGSFMNDAFDGGIAMYQYENLLVRLRNLHEKVGRAS